MRCRRARTTDARSRTNTCCFLQSLAAIISTTRRLWSLRSALTVPPPAGGRGTLRPNSRRRKGNAKSFRGGGAYTAHQTVDNSTDAERETHGNTPNDTGLRRKRTVWSIATKGYTSANGEHYATFPPQLAKNCILAGCKVGGTVLDPFIGSGTVAEVALKHGRNCVGIELNPAYQTLIEERIQNGKRESK